MVKRSLVEPANSIFLGVGIGLGLGGYVHRPGTAPVPTPATPSPLLTSLVGYWTMDEVTGATRLDSTANGNNLADHGGVTQVAGLVSNAAHGDGSSQWLACATPSFSLPNGTSFSGVVWVKWDAGASQGIAVGMDAAANNRDFRVDIDTSANAKATFSVADSGANFNTVSSGAGTVPSGSWHMITYTYDAAAGKQRIRIDGGELVNSNYAAGTGGSTSPFEFLRRDEGATGYLKGAVDESAFWTGRVLDAQDVLSLYNRGAGQTYPFSARVWTKYNSNTNPSVLTPPSGYRAVFEPRVYLSGSAWIMLHTGQTTAGAGNVNFIRRATSSDRRTWTITGTILGGGVGGEASDNLARSSVYRESGTTYVYYYDISGSKINVATSSDDITFTRVATDVAPLASIVGAVALANSCVVKLGTNSYAMILEYMSGGLWHLSYWTGTSPTGNWTLVLNPYATLQTGSSGASGPWLAQAAGGTWHLWFHRGTSDGTLPSRIFHATSADPSMDAWTVTSNGYPILAITETGLVAAVDQVADAWLVDLTTTTELFYDYDENSSGYGANIAVAIYPAGLAQLMTDGG